MRILFGLILSLFALPLQALPEFQLYGHADAGPAFYRVQTLEDGTVTSEIDMYGVRADGTFLPFKDSGFAIKSAGSYARGDGDFISYGVGIGYYIPFFKCCYFVPTMGLSWTDLRTDIDLPGSDFSGLLPPDFVFQDIREKFDSNSRYLGFELMCQVCEPVWATFIYQYAWASTDTVLTHPDFESVLGFPDGKFIKKGTSRGSNFALAFDYYFCENVSASLAGGFNSSLDEDRLGIRAYGVKLSIGYYFK